MGAVYAKDCPNAPGIPVVLIIYGLLMLLGFVWERVKPRINQNSNLIKRIVVVYSSPTVEFEDIDAQNYCNRNVYLLALYLINTYLITLAVCLLVFCCCFGGLFLLGIYMKKE
ncbi:unnamed protein product [Oppiella nova]|uniref:Uncharacterized protein n=1 Tax=Oppiella nova TaxID=334625 RepID=A0A7R9QEB3_9ACAR|nr:unnamed protein product [Oppiella nova]CAG2163617.1 unnamed protein product [Oppiella nova]